MSLIPRWLHSHFATKLVSIDEQYRSERRDGVVCIEVHYRNGTPSTTKILEQSLIYRAVGVITATSACGVIALSS